MNECLSLDRDVAAYLERKLSPERAVELEDHAASCERCYVVLEQASRLRWTLPVQLGPPQEARARVLSAVRERARRNTRYRWLIPLAAAAAILVVTSLGPITKSAQSPVIIATAKLVSERTSGEFEKLATAREEVIAEIAKRPNDPHLKSVLANLDARRRELVQVVGKFKS